MFRLPDLGLLFVFALIGLAASVAAIIGGVAWVIWFALAHVRIV